MRWNLLTISQCDELVKLPIWTTEDDRRRALARLNHSFTGVQAAITAVRTGQKAPANLGVIVAVARYADAGWLPDGNFNHWRRPVWQGGARVNEQMTAERLIEWLGTVESNLQAQLLQSETRMIAQCQKQDEQVVHVQAEAQRGHQRLHTHYQALILAQLSVGNINEARAVACRVPAGSSRDEISSLLHAYNGTSPDKSASPADISAETAKAMHAQDIVREACIAALFAGTTPSDIVPLAIAIAIAQRAAKDLAKVVPSNNDPQLSYSAKPNRLSRAGYHDQIGCYHPTTDTPEFGSHILDCERCQIEWRSHHERSTLGDSP